MNPYSLLWLQVNVDFVCVGPGTLYSWCVYMVRLAWEPVHTLYLHVYVVGLALCGSHNEPRVHYGEILLWLIVMKKVNQHI